MLLNDADKVYLGGTQQDAVYLGTEKVWPPPPPPMSSASVVRSWWASSSNGVVTLTNPGDWQDYDQYIYFIACQASTAITGYSCDWGPYLGNLWTPTVPATADKRFLHAAMSYGAYLQNHPVIFTVAGATTARTIGICVQVRAEWGTAITGVQPQKVQGSSGAGYLATPAIPAGKYGLIACHTTNSANASQSNIHLAMVGNGQVDQKSVPGDGSDLGYTASTNRLSVWKINPTAGGTPEDNMWTSGTVAAGATAAVLIG